MTTPPATSSPRHYLSPTDLTLDQTRALFEIARDLKRSPIRRDLAGKSIALVFFNPSLRTRVSFEVAAYELGAFATTIDVGGGSWKLEFRDGTVMDGDTVEHIKEAAPVLSRYADLITVRAFPLRKSWKEDLCEPVLTSFARHSEVPVINAESALHHPCQSLADLMTIEERLGAAKGEPIVITWAYHPGASPMAVTNSILFEAAKFGMDIRLAHPPGWELDPGIMATARNMAVKAGGQLRVHYDLREALPGARVVYAKEWGSITNYGNNEAELAAKAKYRDAWRVSMSHMQMTDDAFFMHCLPVRRNVVVDDAVLDSPRNAAIDEAENRMHVEKALLLDLLKGR